MYSKTKRIACFLLCFLILFIGFADVLTAPAKAEPITIAAGVSALIWILGLMGITFASVEAARMASENISNSDPDIMEWIDEMFASSGGSGGDDDPNIPDADFLFNSVIIGNFANLMQRLKEKFSGDGDGEMSVPYAGRASFRMDDGTVINAIVGTMDNSIGAYRYVSSFSDYDNVVSLPSAPDGFLTDSICSSYYNDIYQGYSLHYSYNYANLRLNYSDGSFLDRDYSSRAAPYSSDVRLGWGWGVFKDGGHYFATPIFGFEYILDGTLKLVEAGGSFSGFELVTPVEQGVVEVPYKSDAEYSPSQIIEAINDKIARDGPFTVTIPQATEDTIKKTQDDIITDIGIKDLLEDIKNNTDPEQDEEFDPDKNKMPRDLIYKFPFCVPFDLIDLVGALNAPSKAPVFTVPVRFDFVNYADEIVIDLSGWEKAAQAIRWGTTLFFILGLTVVTRKMIQG